MSRFLNSRYSSLDRYVPGEQPQDKKYIKLNTNESPFPPSPKVIEGINEEEKEKLCLYCDPECKELKAALAGLYGVGTENVFLSNGSDDILNFAFMVWGKNGAIFPDITYGFYTVFCELHGVEYKEIPLKEDFSVSAEDYIGKNKMIVIANPNAPTGMTMDMSDIERIVASNPDSVVLIDEAYVDFGGESALPLTKKYDNILVCQTYSKSRSLAGARLGFAIGNKALIEDLDLIKYSTNPYNVNRLTQKAGKYAIDENDYYVANCKKIMENREYTRKQLEELGFTVLDSKANFIFAKSDKISGADLYTALKDKGVLVRHFTKERIKDFNRVTIGSMEQMEKFIEAVTQILKGE
ncbi:MAG: histidinol-phosphate transaminase [Clostridia bacterium]|nr:histidinol-phosphate transaminase [Clostridia bacterium]